MTIDLGNRTVYPDGTVICNQSALVDILYNGLDLQGVFCRDQEDEQEWATAAKLCDSNVHGPTAADNPVYTDVDWYQHWMTPEAYANLDIAEWCYNRCTTDQERQRVDIELAAMTARNMLPIIRHLIYCVDVWRANGVVWGVGRGSSVGSFILYLTGVNRINPLEHDLDLNEWLK